MDKDIVDIRTGEVVDRLVSGDRIVREKSVEYLTAIRIWKVDHFYKGNLGEIRKWMPELSPNEKALLFTVSPFVGYEDCCLKKENGDMLAFDDMVMLSGLSRGAVSNTLNELISKDILYRGKNSRERQYFMNPWLFCKGNRINTVLKTMFQNYRIRVCAHRKWKDLPE
jgi:hypothetical protein